MKTSGAGIALIKKYEGCRLTAYHISGEKYYTIGWGHYGADVKAGQKITQAKADSLLSDDVKTAEKYVKYYVTYKLNQNQFDALVDFTYNMGCGNLSKMVKGRSLTDIGNQLTKYDTRASRANRRKEEKTLFFKKTTSESISKATKDLVSVAISQLGYKESGDNRTKYGAWMGMNGAAWCHSFVSWCANQAGVATGIVPKTASTTVGINFYKNKKRFGYKGSYTPERNDLIYFKSAGASHVGIVEYVKGNTVHTIEGNTSNAVKRRQYALSYKTITGYGKVNAYLSVDSSGSKTNASQTVDYQELDLRLGNQSVTSGTFQKKLDLALILVDDFSSNAGTKYDVPLVDGCELTLERKGTPGKLVFDIFKSHYQQAEWSVWPGSAVMLTVNGYKIFYGFVFTAESSGADTVTITAYDQLRYMKNKDTLVYEGLTASQLLIYIAKKYKLKLGKVDNTLLKLSRSEDGQTLFDILQNALDETTYSTGRKYVLYDNCGKLTLRELSKMKLNSYVLNEDTIQEISTKRTIDDAFYTRFKFVYKDSDGNSQVAEFSKDSGYSEGRYGVLQYYEDCGSSPPSYAKTSAIRKLYLEPVETMSVSGVYGKPSVRAGTLLPVNLSTLLGVYRQYLIVEKVTHHFSNREHTMDLTFSGGMLSG